MQYVVYIVCEYECPLLRLLMRLLLLLLFRWSVCVCVRVGRVVILDSGVGGVLWKCLLVIVCV